MNNRNKATGLAYFLGGISVYIFAPVFESFANWLTSVINSHIAKMQMGLELDQAEHQAAIDVVSPVPPTATAAVGFQIPSEEEYEEEYDE